MAFIRAGRSSASVAAAPSPPPGDPIPADAVWIAPGGNDSTGAGTYANPYATFAKAFTVVASGGTIAAKNGTYTVPCGVTGTQPPNGTAGNLTRIRCETEGSVTINMSATDYCAHLTGSYVSFEGFRCINGSEFCGSFDGSNLQIKRCFFGNSDNTNFALHYSLTGTNNLVEDCWSCGRGRGTIIYGTGHVIRRVVTRLDYYSGDQGYMAFTNYDANNVIWENCIAIDVATAATAFDWKGGFRTRDIFEERTHSIYGCIALNTRYDGFRVVGTNMKDCVAWAINGRGGIYEDQIYTARTIANCTVGSTTNGGITLQGSNLNSSLHVSVSGGNSTGDYCHYWNTTSPGGTNVITTNPNQLYITRVEDGTPGDGTGLSGVDRGATVLKRYESGTLTSTNLWPWPNEDRIKSDFLTDFSLPGVTVARGFCTGTSIDGNSQTLTKYIWEYLGNQIPAGIY